MWRLLCGWLIDSSRAQPLGFVPYNHFTEPKGGHTWMWTQQSNLCLMWSLRPKGDIGADTSLLLIIWHNYCSMFSCGDKAFKEKEAHPQQKLYPNNKPWYSKHHRLRLLNPDLYSLQSITHQTVHSFWLLKLWCSWRKSHNSRTIILSEHKLSILVLLFYMLIFL